jgi:hypothetical protein
LRPFQLILQSYWTSTKQTLSPPPPQFNVVNNAETTFGNIPWYKLNIELGERGFKNGNMIQHGVYHKNTRIFYRGKIVSTSYVQDWDVKLVRAKLSKRDNILCCLRLLYIEYSWFPVTCFETVVVGGWVKQIFARTCEPLNSKFGGTLPTCSSPTQNRVCLAPPNHTFILPPIYNLYTN